MNDFTYDTNNKPAPEPQNTIPDLNLDSPPSAPPALPVPAPLLADHHDGILSLFSFLAALYFTTFILFGGFGIAVPILIALIYTINFFYMKACHISPSTRALWLLPLIILSAAAFGLFQSVLLVLNFFFLFTVLFYHLYVMYGLSRGSLLKDFIPVISLPFCNFTKALPSFSMLFRKGKKGSYALFAILALLLALPLTIVVLDLLLSADAAFSTLWNNVFRFNFSVPELLVKLFLALPLWGLLFSFLYSLRYKKETKEWIPFTRKLPFYTIFIGFLPIISLYILFFISQFMYLQNVAARIFPQGFRYASYARQGFFELCALTCINLVIILFIGLCSKNEKAARILQAVLSAFTLGFISMALWKMLLYIRCYALTLLRVYTSWFMIFLVLIFIFLLCKIFHPKLKILGLSTVTAAIMFLFLLYGNVDLLVANYNIERYQSGQVQELDLDAFSDLSDAMVPSLAALREDEILGKKAEQILMSRCYSILYRSNWENWNLSTQLAKNALPDFADLAAAAAYDGDLVTQDSDGHF